MTVALDLVRRLESDTALRTRFLDAPSRESIAALLDELGYTFSVEALGQAVEARRRGEMNEAELGALAGGAGVPDNLSSLLTVLQSFRSH